MQQLRAYVTSNGKSPFLHWLESLREKEIRHRIKAYLDRLVVGNFSNCKSVGHGVFELKMNFGPGFRVYFGQVGVEIILLLCGGDKRTQRWDIKKAIDLWKDYLERKNEGQNEL